MKKQPSYKKITDHPDKDEIISKLVIGVTPKEICEWLKEKYSSVGESKFILTEKSLKEFKDDYLDFYNDMQADLQSVRSSMVTKSEENLSDMVKSNPTYKEMLEKVAGKELDIETILANMAISVEHRIGQIFDMIQEDPRNVNTRIERLWIEYVDSLGNMLDKYYKWKEKKVPDTLIQNNVTLQIADSHISALHDTIREILSEMDLSDSQKFLELFQEKVTSLKPPTATPSYSPPQITQDAKYAEVKLLNDTISKKINL